MDERTIKRLLIILVVSIIAVVLLKMGLIRTYATLSKAAVEKKQAAAKPSAPVQAPTFPAAAEIIEPPAASSVDQANTADLPASSGVSEAR